MTNKNRNHVRKTEKRCGSTRMRKLASAITLVVASTAAAGALAMTPTIAPVAQADATCQTVLWGFLGSQDRTLCDGPVFADGSWMRRRIIWTPAHYVPLTTNCYGGRYYTSCTTTGGYPVAQHVWSDETYPVTPETVLPDEPGHIEGGL